ncbi:hypothetical protein LEMLEM_LOCUS8548 [Lemmus lemmus]
MVRVTGDTPVHLRWEMMVRCRTLKTVEQLTTPQSNWRHPRAPQVGDDGEVQDPEPQRSRSSGPQN